MKLSIDPEGDLSWDGNVPKPYICLQAADVCIVFKVDNHLVESRLTNYAGRSKPVTVKLNLIPGIFVPELQRLDVPLDGDWITIKLVSVTRLQYAALDKFLKTFVAKKVLVLTNAKHSKDVRPSRETKGTHFIAANGSKIVVTPDDLKRLQPSEWVSTTIIEFGLSHFRPEGPRTDFKIDYFNTFFYSTLRNQGYDRVKKWGEKLNVFSLDLIVIPIHESDHWFLALVYKPGHMLRGDQSYIFTLDSYAPHAATRHAGVVQLLGTYLRKEYSRVTDGIPPQDFTEPVSKMVPVLSQQNHYDCGIYLIHFHRILMQDPERNLENILRGQEINWDSDAVAVLRTLLIAELQSIVRS